MNRNSLLLLFLSGLLIVSCSKPDTGLAKETVGELYPYRDYLSTTYTESMIRSAANLAGLDSSFAISSHTDYIYQFEVGKRSGVYIPSTDSVIHHALENSGMDKLVEVNMPNQHYSGYVRTAGDKIVDAVYFEHDTNVVKLFEFVGNMPIDVLFKEGMSSYAEFGDFLNLELLTDERNDTTDQ